MIDANLAAAAVLTPIGLLAGTLFRITEYRIECRKKGLTTPSGSFLLKAFMKDNWKNLLIFYILILAIFAVWR